MKEIQKEDTISETEDVPEPDETESIAESVPDPILTYPDQVIIFLSKNTNEMLIRKLPQIKDRFIFTAEQIIYELTPKIVNFLSCNHGREPIQE